MFRTLDLFSIALMIELPWFIDKKAFDQVKGTLDVWIDFERGYDEPDN